MSSPDLSDFARERFSPLAFDERHVIGGDAVEALLEAAGRAPSAGNSQPWAFVVGVRGDEVHQRMARHLARSSSAWAPTASLLLANLSRQLVDDSDLEYSEFARYDLGQAVAHLSFQAHALGLAVHQFRAFDRDAMAAEFAIPHAWEVTTMAAIGVPAHAPGDLAGAGTSRERLPVAEIRWEV
ncbi:nitroreductase family protein [Nocardioides nematodiphilus]|uniref:nitroreductase family protein n=1 Tax=Nocardioides nematodiphilus TaxID=2849669 RepID=UPI001CD9417D|nr:nitroreductase family protein [Nocardioides nematodiphilus]MCA1982127.1 nitroreductase family protein [Nocardioides nematodiphilus]